ncbi:hypothetical protein [Rhodoligotrophos appendicifer]|uniref:hypothetical protein n=1 Tax=Rhodoligotrophos appendicifer TaxID=987056 RepID=UPI003D17CCF4
MPKHLVVSLSRTTIKESLGTCSLQTAKRKPNLPRVWDAAGARPTAVINCQGSYGARTLGWRPLD